MKTKRWKPKLQKPQKQSVIYIMHIDQNKIDTYIALNHYNK